MAKSESIRNSKKKKKQMSLRLNLDENWNVLLNFYIHYYLVEVKYVRNVRKIKWFLLKICRISLLPMIWILLAILFFITHLSTVLETYKNLILVCNHHPLHKLFYNRRPVTLAYRSQDAVATVSHSSVKQSCFLRKIAWKLSVWAVCLRKHHRSTTVRRQRQEHPEY